ncbi:MAG: UbiA family prenyltransferase, partial [Methylococcales bacterium]|nr:UbiA family prenyltransferase [Methylococcales bacterium]
MINKLAVFPWKNYLAVCKPRVVALIVFTVIVGMLLSTPGMPPLDNFIYGVTGIGLAASSAAAINHFIDQKADAEMTRTKYRPLPMGEISSRNALVFAGIIGVIAMLLLIVKVNVLTAFLTFLSLIGYAV